MNTQPHYQDPKTKKTSVQSISEGKFNLLVEDVEKALHTLKCSMPDKQFKKACEVYVKKELKEAKVSVELGVMKKINLWINKHRSDTNLKKTNKDFKAQNKTIRKAQNKGMSL